MSLATPSKIRELQIKLYRKAKNEPGYRFYMLYDKIWREDILAHAYAQARANKGAPGVDGQTFEQVESVGLEEWLTGIRQELRNKTYQPQPVRRVMIPKPGGGERPLGIPNDSQPIAAIWRRTTAMVSARDVISVPHLVEQCAGGRALYPQRSSGM